MSEARLARVTWPEAEDGAARNTTTLLIPLGATEQHGPHLPLGTDIEIAVAIAEAAAKRLPGAFVAPALPYGSSAEHQAFPGTLSIGAVCTELVLVELGRSASETFDRLVFVNGHGGNAAPVAAAMELLLAEGHDAVAWFPRFGGDAHAGRTETSLMLALCPDRIRGERAVPGNAAPLAELIDDLRAGGVRPLSSSGILGDPTGASVEEGRALLGEVVENLCASLRDPSARATGGGR